LPRLLSAADERNSQERGEQQGGGGHGGGSPRRLLRLLLDRFNKAAGVTVRRGAFDWASRRGAA